MSEGTRSTVIPKLFAFLGIAAMVVLGIVELFTLDIAGTGDRILCLTYGGVGAGLVATAGAIAWVVRATRKGWAIAVLVISILMNPIWLLLLIRAFG